MIKLNILVIFDFNCYDVYFFMVGLLNVMI